MKHQKSITILTVIIAILSLGAAVYGVLSGGGVGSHFISLHGQTVPIYGKGLYQNDSVSVAAQAIGQDIVTIILGIPLLIIALILAGKGHLKGKLLLTGTLGYFLYTYISYSFYSMYNALFLVDVILMSASFFAFVLSIMTIDVKNLGSAFGVKLPVKLVGGLLIFIASAVGLMWLKLIITPLLAGSVPSQLEHYTTLTIQAMDLGFVVPAAILSGILLIKRNAYGYLLATIMIIKEATMLTAITAMIIVQALNGVAMSIPVIVAFLVFDLVIIACLALVMKHLKEPLRG